MCSSDWRWVGDDPDRRNAIDILPAERVSELSLAIPADWDKEQAIALGYWILAKTVDRTEWE